MTEYRLYIDGAFRDATSNRWIDVINPATQEVIARVPDANAADIDEAVRAARRAFEGGPWREVTAQERGRILLRLAQIVRDHAAEWAELETVNNGKPIVESEFDIADVATCFEYYGGLATKIHGDVIPVPDNALSLACRRRGLPVAHGRGFDDLPSDVRDGFLSALVTSLERDELLRALGCAIAGLLREVEQVKELAAKVEPQLRELTVAWDRE